MTHSTILVWRIPCRKESDMTEKVSLAQVALVVKNLSANAGDAREKGSIPGSGRSSGVGNGNPFQYSCLGSPVDREA